MKKISIIFLQTIIVLIGLGALAFLIYEPQLEGANAHTTLFEIYFKDPFLALVYIGSIPFFIGLYKAIRILRYIGKEKTFSLETKKSLRAIKHCALAVIGFVLVAEVFIVLNHGNDDPAGGIFVGMVIIFVSLIIINAEIILENILKEKMEK